MPNYFEFFVDGQPIVASHYPLASWNGMAKGSFMLHGHCHNRLQESRVGKELNMGKIMDFGVENCPYPLSFAEIKEIMDNKPIIQTDHHDSKTQNPF